MGLDEAYFDSINLEIAKKKYYNANKVEAVLADIRAQALAMNTELSDLRAKLAELSTIKGNISDTLFSATTVSRSMISEAVERSDEIIQNAEKKAEEIIAEAEQIAEVKQNEIHSRENELTMKYKSALARIKGLQLQLLDELDEEIEVFGSDVGDDVPDDLEQKIGAIADKLFSIGNEE